MLSAVSRITSSALRVAGGAGSLGASPSVRLAAPCLATGAQVRYLNVHEHVGMSLMAEYDISTPDFRVSTTPEDARAAFEELSEDGEKDVVIKAQVLAGGRGLGYFKNGFQGGVHMCTRSSQASDFADKMLGQVLVTKQTGDEGKPCNTVLLSERVYMRRELYFSILMDRSHSGPVIVASTQGGTSIEDVAEATPELIFKETIDIKEGLTDDILDRLATNLKFGEKTKEKAKTVFANLYRMFLETDATLVEINPLAETNDSRVLVCDAKLNFDDNAEFRQDHVFEHRDITQEDAREVSAAKYDLNYIGLDGTIGCMVNGAGLAMATMDIIKLHGGQPANFLDVGGGATATQVQKAFEILNADPKVKSILVNIFGGIMRCDVIAHGILQAANEIMLSKPIVVRLQGTNVEEAKMLIDSSGHRMIMADDLDEAALKAVQVAKIVEAAEAVDLGVSFELPL